MASARTSPPSESTSNGGGVYDTTSGPISITCPLVTSRTFDPPATPPEIVHDWLFFRANQLLFSKDAGRSGHENVMSIVGPTMLKTADTGTGGSSTDKKVGLRELGQPPVRRRYTRAAPYTLALSDRPVGSIKSGNRAGRRTRKATFHNGE